MTENAEKQNRIRTAIENLKQLSSTWIDDISRAVRAREDLSEEDSDRLCFLVLNIYTAIKWSLGATNLHQAIDSDDSLLLFIELVHKILTETTESVQLSAIIQAFLGIKKITCQRMHYNALENVMADVKFKIGALADFEKRLDNKIADATKKFDTISAEAGEKLTGNSLNTFATMFSDINVGERKAANWWLVGSVAFGLLALANSVYHVAMMILGKAGVVSEKDIILVVSLTLFCLIASAWTARRYSVAYTQAVTYRHLSCILGTFNRFRGSMSATEQELITLEAARTLFPVPKTASKVTDSGLNLAVVVDLIKTLNPQKDDSGSKKDG